MKAITVLLLSAFVLHPSSFVFAQGPLTPTAAPAPTMRTLAQVEPRTPISSAPITITASGSYYLTTNLTGVAGFDGVVIQADNVTLDLNGFAVIGVASSGPGVFVSGAHTNICVRNGSVLNWSSGGVALGAARNSQLADLRVSGNVGTGLLIGDGGLIVRCTATANGGGGIDTSAGRNCIVKDCTAEQNAGGGISVGNGSTVISCAALTNASSGIFATYGSTIKACTSTANTGRGITASQGRCLVQDCTATGNSGDGIAVQDDSFVIDCLSTSNAASAAGISVLGSFGGNRIQDNNVTFNGIGINAFTGIGNLIIRNSAHGNGTNYVLGGSPTFGPTNNLSDASGLITNQNPWANFSF